MIALVGIDGSGKTTQAVRLTEALRASGHRVRYGPNPGGRRWLARASRRLAGTDPVRLLGRRGLLAVESTLRWLAIARSLLAANLTGRISVMDRYSVCQRVSVRVHGGGRLLSRLVHLAYSMFPAPDLLILLDIDPQVAYQRIEHRGTDHEELSYLRATGAAYRELAENAVHIDGGLTEDEVAQAVWKLLLTQSDVDTG
ncbi:thymidylate kinase [Rhizocola hellebori]|uniref:Thymidylate kinase n=1 Tax=Rhizocola hellebori TaxID=1392758 RepID=A0A8J3Q837_9ACTN|nr:thymidylate kinase [Rhizocola hellebori]